jgi:outer membrane biosynthesis protein TonB
MVAMVKGFSSVWPSRWGGGGLLLLLSLGLHGVVLSMPMGDRAPDADSAAEMAQPLGGGDVIDVVALPAPPPEPVAPLPEAAVPVAPQEVASQPTTAIAPPVAATQPAPAPQPQPSQPEPTTPEPTTPEPTTTQPPPEPPPPTTPTERLHTLSEYQYVDRNKSLSTDTTLFTFDVVPDWIAEESQGLSEEQTPELGNKLATLSITYPLTTCLPAPPAEGLVGVIVNADGSLAKAPRLLDSTNYDVLDDYALEQATQQSFPSHTRQNPRAHWLPVQVLYDGANCTPEAP